MALRQDVRNQKPKPVIAGPFGGQFQRSMRSLRTRQKTEFTRPRRPDDKIPQGVDAIAEGGKQDAANTASAQLDIIPYEMGAKARKMDLKQFRDSVKDYMVICKITIDQATIANYAFTKDGYRIYQRWTR